MYERCVIVVVGGGEERSAAHEYLLGRGAGAAISSSEDGTAEHSRRLVCRSGHAIEGHGSATHRRVCIGWNTGWANKGACGTGIAHIATTVRVRSTRPTLMPVLPVL